MMSSAASHSEPARDPSRRPDRGFSLVEAVVAIALMGMLVVSTLALLRTSVKAGTFHRDHANAHAWLQSAADRLYAIDKEPCDPAQADAGEAAVRAVYDTAIDLVPNPEGWTDSQISVVYPVEFWNAEDANNDEITEFSFGSACHEGDGLSLQRIQIQVESETGSIIEAVEIVK